MVETSRLLISPLNREQLSLYLQANDLFEKSMGLACNNRIVVPAVQDMVTKFTIPRMAHATADNYLFYTFWIVVEKSSRLIVAELGFKGVPTGNGEIEIGYGTMPAHQGKGFMTEAVGGMLGWGRNRPDVTCIVAETDETNAASIRVLLKNHFIQYTRKGNMLWWKYKFEDYSGLIPT
ncbi:GNAT family N-acetyltransferase [Pseudoflavitalea sp. X16]|uniref:GNAT family N-acetyltransferase n=1 Tax=Paraflavitalea devenefica TaxID=2716334 RepID=UPI0014231180|nr:GNAT family N-acetyltransferase [Paraflavitalea devenefica]NII29565.1 GNAT family N-acetyltransferase [Paraflavitalea devenefica]